MKIALTAASLFFVFAAQAQLEIPNPSFENWEIINTWNPTPVDWITQNWQLNDNTYVDSAACHENVSMAVRPVLGFETSAGMAHTQIDTDYIPANFSFCVKRYVDIPQDTVKVRLRFWNQASDPELMVYEKSWITSDTDTTWNYITLSLDQIEPIMHAVTIEVIAGYNGPLGGGSALTWIAVDDMKFDMVDGVEEERLQFELIVAGEEIRLRGVETYQMKHPRIQLFDLSGKLVAATSESVLNFSHLRAGIYIATLSIDGQTVSTKRAFKQ